MTFETLAYLVLGAAMGGFINGLAGTGTALFALGFVLMALDPIPAVAVIALMSVVSGFQGLWVVRKQILSRPGRLLRFLVPGLVGVPIGIVLLRYVDAEVLRISIGVLLLVFGSYFGLRASLPAFDKKTSVLDSGIGFAGGVLGAAALSGTLPTLWLSLRPWPKAETRAVLQPYNFVILSTAIVMLAASGAFDASARQALVIVLPVGALSAYVGILVFKRLSDQAFRRTLVLMTFAMGAGVLASVLLCTQS